MAVAADEARHGASGGSAMAVVMAATSAAARVAARVRRPRVAASEGSGEGGGDGGVPTFSARGNTCVQGKKPPVEKHLVGSLVYHRKALSELYNSVPGMVRQFRNVRRVGGLGSLRRVLPERLQVS
jgi:hypothetical protein